MHNLSLLWLQYKSFCHLWRWIVYETLIRIKFISNHFFSLTKINSLSVSFAIIPKFDSWASNSFQLWKQERANRLPDEWANPTSICWNIYKLRREFYWGYGHIPAALWIQQQIKESFNLKAIFLVEINWDKCLCIRERVCVHDMNDKIDDTLNTYSVRRPSHAKFKPLVVV